MADSTSLEARERLLGAALRLFADRGYAGTAVQDLVEMAGVTKPVLYYYFESKGGLFQALIDRAVEERLRLMQEAAPSGKPTVDALTDILTALTTFARQQPDLLRLSFAVAFAAPGEMPEGFRLPHKIGASIHFVHELIRAGRETGELNGAFSTQELAEGYFQMIQHQVAVAVLGTRTPPPGLPPLPPPAAPQRAIELFLQGAARKKAVPTRNGPAKALLAAGLLVLLPLGLSAQELTPKVTTDPGVSTNVVPTAPAASQPNAPVAPVEPAGAAPVAPEGTVRAETATGPTTDDVRPVPLAVRASHPELATVSPIEANAHDPAALDLQTCFRLTAERDDSLKIDLTDIEVARAQLSQSLAALWPTFNVTNEQQFLHYSSLGSSTSFSSSGETTGTSTGTTSTGTGLGQSGAGQTGSASDATTTTSSSGFTQTGENRHHTSQSNVTMSYTIFNGGQNYNTVGASRALVAAKRETLSREYQTIYQDVAQGFYDALQYQGDLVIQHDLIEALSARVDDLIGRVKLGRSRPSEMLQAQTDLANARVTYEQQLGSSNAALETVAFYIGIPASRFRLKDTGRFPTTGTLEYYLQQSGARPDVLSQLQSLRQAERNLSVAKGELFPTVTASGDYLGQQDPESNNVDATLTLQISMPIFDGGLILGQIHEKHELVRESALNVEQLERTADQDTRTAYVNFKAAVAQVVVLREAARFAAKNLEAQVEDYRRGVVSNLDVLTALRDYQTARVQLHNANMTARLDLIDLHVAAGLAARGPGADNRALPAHIEGVAR